MCGEGTGSAPTSRLKVAKYIRDRVGKSFISEIVRAAQNRMRDLEMLLDTFYDNEDIIPGIQRSTQYTYEALFGTVYWGPDDKYFVKNFDGRERFNHVMSRLDKLQDMILSDDRVQIWCTDHFITKKIPRYFQPHRLPPSAYWDERSPESGGQALVMLDRAAKCDTDPVIGNKAYTVTTRPYYETMGIVILCPQNLFPDHPLSKTMPSLSQFPSLKQMDFPDLYPLDNIVNGNIVFLFISMLTRLNMTGNTAMTTVTPPPVAGRNLFGWQAAAILPMIYPEKTLNNADSYAYLIFALALDRNDWSTGMAVPMLPTETGITHFYQSINWAYEQLTRQGDPEHPPEMDWVVD